MKKLFTLLLVCFFATGVTFASFPVEKEQSIKKETTISVVEGAANNEIAEIVRVSELLEKNVSKKSSRNSGSSDLLPLVLLWVFLGGFAAHRWYAGKPVGANILFILTAGGCGIWAIIDLVKILTNKFN